MLAPVVGRVFSQTREHKGGNILWAYFTRLKSALYFKRERVTGRTDDFAGSVQTQSNAFETVDGIVFVVAKKQVGFPGVSLGLVVAVEPIEVAVFLALLRQLGIKDIDPRIRSVAQVYRVKSASDIVPVDSAY